MPRDVVRLIKSFAAEPHPTAKMIKALLFVDTTYEKIALSEDPEVTFLTIGFVRRRFQYDPDTMRFKHERNRLCTHRCRTLITSIRDASG